MDKKEEIKIFVYGIILLGVIFLIIWAIQAKKINPQASLARSASLSLSPAIGSLKLGETYQQKVIIDAHDLKSSGAEVIINFDPHTVEIVDQDSQTDGIQIKPGPLYLNYYENLVDAESGVIRISATDKNSGLLSTIINFPSVFATFDFRPIKESSALEFNFKFENGKTNDCNVFENLGKAGEQDVLFGILNASFSVQS